MVINQELCSNGFRTDGSFHANQRQLVSMRSIVRIVNYIAQQQTEQT